MSPDIDDILCEEGEDAARAFRDSAKPFKPEINGNGHGGDPGPEPGQPKPNDTNGKKRRFRLERFKDLKASTVPAYLIRDIIPRTGIVVIWGPPKCGKTFTTHDMFMHVALGWDYRGRRVKQGTVVYVAAEGALGLRTRTDGWHQHHAEELKNNGVSAEDVPFYLIDAQVDLARDADALIADIRAGLGPSVPAVVVIDTLNRTINGSENKDEDMGRFIKAADTIQRAFGCVVVIIHHCGVSGDRPRGHTSLIGANDAQIAVVRDEAGLVTMTVEHMKDGEGGATTKSRLKPVPLVGKDGQPLTNTDGDPITSCVVMPADDNVGDGQGLDSRLTGYAKIGFEQLRDLIASGAGEVIGSNHIPQKRTSVDVRLWRESFYNATVKPDINPDSQRKNFERAWKRLRDLNLIGIWNDRVWLTGHSGHRRT